jgi:hypothetical protein
MPSEADWFASLSTPTFQISDRFLDVLVARAQMIGDAGFRQYINLIEI